MYSAAANRFQRIFLIFSNEDNGFEEGKKPSGYLKLEIRNGKGRLDTVLHNLRDGKGRYIYALYLIRTSSDPVEYVRVGEVRYISGRNVLEWVFDPEYVGSSTYAIGEFDTAAILAEYENRMSSGIICPLAAYRDKRTDWRNGLRRALQTAASYQKTGKAPFPIPETGSEQEPELRYEPETGSEQKPELRYEPEMGSEQKPEPDREFGSEAGNKIEPEADRIESESAEPLPLQLSAQIDELKTAGTYYEIQPATENVTTSYQTQKELESQESQCYSYPATEAQPGVQYKGKDVTSPEAYAQPEEDGYAYPEADVQPEEKPVEEGVAHTTVRSSDTLDTSDKKPKPSASRQTVHEDVAEPVRQVQKPLNKDIDHNGKLKGINTDCVYLNGNLCDAFVKNENSCDPCKSCSIRHGETPAEARPSGDLERFTEELDKNFETSDPFHSRRRDYKWWRVTNPVNLNNILYQNNIRSPLMFNPAVMMAHYKYRHLIIGIFTHKNGRKYVVCGVPGMHMVDMKPFGEMNTWVQAEGSRLRYGAFGYWLVYIDPENGKIMKPGKD